MAESEGARIESDLLGDVRVPAGVLYGVHTLRAMANFPLTGRPVNKALIHAYGDVKLAAALTNRGLGAWGGEPAKADAILAACREMSAGLLDSHVVVDALQGGAGTSTNMNVNEVLANRALVVMGLQPGEYARVSPLDDINMHQSTNDTYPTALRVAAIRGVRVLDQALVGLMEAFQDLERELADVVKLARTQFQDAVLTTLGREMGAYAEAFGRDRWRVYKCEERLRVVNLGGTAVGTGLGAPRKYIFRVVDVLREETGIGLARAENLVDATQNADVFVEVSGILKATAVSLIKVANDLRLMSSGPDGGLGEIRLPPRQAGSSIMPGKVNPVIPEAVIQASWQVIANDMIITQAASSGSLDLNPFMPAIADALLSSLDLLARACDVFRGACVAGIEADVERCGHLVEGAVATATALVPALGYEQVERIVASSRERGVSIREVVIGDKILDQSAWDELLSAEAVKRLGNP